MCLHTVSKRFSPPDPKVRKAWKFVVQDGEGYFKAPFQTCVYSTSWQVAKGELISTGIGEHLIGEYLTGFHVFPSREEARKAKRALAKEDYRPARKYKLAKVEVKYVTYEGIDGSSTDLSYLGAQIKTLVAKNMRIVKIVKD